MRKFLCLSTTLILYLSIFIACNKQKEKENIVLDNGTIAVVNTKGTSDSIVYTCIGCSLNIKDTTAFNSIITEIATRTKDNLKFPLTFMPIELNLTVGTHDSLYYFDTNQKIENLIGISYSFKYIGKNAFGNEIEQESHSLIYLKDNQIIDLENEIKLKKLAIDTVSKGLFINRSFSIFGKDGDFVEIIPYVERKAYMVTSSLNCVDEGTWLYITLENDENVKLSSFNNFNCEGRLSFSDLKPSQVALLKQYKIKEISIMSDSGNMGCTVPKNKSDYFIQLMNLLYPEKHQ